MYELPASAFAGVGIGGPGYDPGVRVNAQLSYLRETGHTRGTVSIGISPSGKVSFIDGRHRVTAAQRLGTGSVFVRIYRSTE